MSQPAETFEQLYNEAPFGYLSTDLDGRIIRSNRTFSDWTGYEPDRLLGKSLRDFLALGSRIFFETNVAPLIAMQDGFDDVALDLRTAAGNAFAVSSSARVLRSKQDKSAVVRIAFFKAAERRRYEKQLIESNRTIQVSERTAQSLLQNERSTAELREQFIAVLGHDLRNPLASIIGGLRLLQKDQPPERRQHVITLLEGSVSRMASLIDNVLDFARGRLGAGIPLDLRTNVDIAPLIGQVVAELRTAAPERIIKTDVPASLPVTCDPVRIAQLISNLLGNAFAHGAPNEPVQVHASAGDQKLIVWVANRGLPIPLEAVPRLFQPFFRGDVRASQQGLGLGLYICSEIAKAHGGSLVVTSNETETRFTFEMPLGV